MAVGIDDFKSVFHGDSPSWLSADNASRRGVTTLTYIDQTALIGKYRRRGRRLRHRGSAGDMPYRWRISRSAIFYWGVLLIIPTAAERFIKRHQIRRHIGFAVGQIVFRPVDRTLGVEHGEERDQSLGV